MAGIGDFNFLGTYQVNTPTQTATGGFVDSYATLLTAWGKLRRSGARKSTEVKLEIGSSWVWECYFQSALTINIKNRWLIDGRTFAIEDYELIDQKKAFYKFKLLAVE